MKTEMIMKPNNTAIILLSGGLDSLVALDYVKRNENIDIKLALTFSYGQKAAKKEIEASENICKYYDISHKIITLDWLKDITKTELVTGKQTSKDGLSPDDKAKLVWVPNRNALFLNVAGCYCDAFGYKYIIYGANKEEGQCFPDNTEEFRKQISMVFKTSTQVQPEVLAPLIKYNKDDIVKVAVKNSVPLELVWSCYGAGSKHCGVCESCSYLKKALIANHCEKYVNLLFGNEN